VEQSSKQSAALTALGAVLTTPANDPEAWKVVFKKQVGRPITDEEVKEVRAHATALREKIRTAGADLVREIEGKILIGPPPGGGP
jgi:hypothetical protein